MKKGAKLWRAFPEILGMKETWGLMITFMRQLGLRSLVKLPRYVTALLGLSRKGIAGLFVLLWDLFGEREAIVSGEKRFTFREYKERVFRLANGLQSLGVKPKESIAEILNNGNEFLEMVFACSLVGCPMPFVNWHMKGDELAATINRRSPRVVVFEGEFIDKILEIKDKLNSVEHWIVVGDKVPAGMISYEDLIANSPTKMPKANFILALNPYTAGTTGVPKSSNYYDGIGYLMSDLAEGPRINLKEYVRLLIKEFSFLYWYGGAEISDKISHNIRCLIPTPMYHAGTIVGWAPFLLLGATAVTMREFDPEEFLRLIERERINWTFVAPTILQRVLALPDEIKHRYDLSSMHSLICAAAPCPVEVKKEINELFLRQGAKRNVFNEYYGSAETAIITILLPGDYAENPKRYASVGKPRCADLRIFNDKQKTWCQPNEEGLVLSRSCTTVSLRYPGSEEKLPESIKIIDGEEWFDDGLLGYADEDGFLYLTSRVKEMLISGGVNIYPHEIESIILKHPKVFDVAVIPVPDKDLGEVPAAIVQLKEGEKMGEDEVMEHCKKNNLYGFKLPKLVEFVKELPRHVDGKVMKRELEEKYWKGMERRG